MTRGETVGGSEGELTVEIPTRTTKLLDLPSGVSEAVQSLERNLPRGVRATVTFTRAEPPPGLVLLAEHLAELEKRGFRISEFRISNPS